MAAKLGSSGAQCFLYNCYLAYNPFFTFNVKKVPETKDLVNKDNPWVTFWGLVEALRTRSITGNRARDKIDEISQQFDSDEWNGLARRVLIKDLRCGISEKTLNKVLGKTDWRIPIFSCQLAQDSTDQPKKLRGIKRLECKLDGVRVLAVVNGDVCTLYSRNGKEFENFPQIADFIEENRKAFQFGTGFAGQYVLDGEIVGESFQALMKQAQRKSNARTDDMVYHVFDILPLSAFREGHWNAQLHKRIKILEDMRSIIDDMPNVELLPHIMVDLDTAAGVDQLQRYAKDQVNAGFEGIMIKNVDAPYVCKRSTDWMKWKPTITVDLTVVGLEEGTGRNAGRLGALVCEGEDDGKFIQVNVGSGYSDEDRDSYWADSNLIIGRTAEILCDVVTQNRDGTYSLRFPRFVRFRDDK